MSIIPRCPGGEFNTKRAKLAGNDPATAMISNPEVSNRKWKDEEAELQLT